MIAYFHFIFVTLWIDQKEIEMELYLKYLLRNNNTDRLVEWVRVGTQGQGEVLHRVLAQEGGLCTEMTRQVVITELFR